MCRAPHRLPINPYLVIGLFAAGNAYGTSQTIAQNEFGKNGAGILTMLNYGLQAGAAKGARQAKNMDGWIFGDEKSAQWTQSLYGKKYRFQNPLHQNYRHTKALQEFLGIDESKLISLVMFWGECEFKTPMPDNVRSTGYTSFIKKHTAVLLTDDEVTQFVSAIQTGKMPKGIVKSFETRAAHLASLKDRHDSTSTCPKCANALVLRTVKSGPKVGSQFYGCSAFPKCRYTRAIA